MIPKNIGKEHIVQAIEKVKTEGIPNDKRQSKKYVLIFERREFPPKYIISLANEFANNSFLGHDEFTSQAANSLLNKLGFEVRISSINQGETPVFYKLQIKDDQNNINRVDEVLLENRITSNLDFAGRIFDNLQLNDIVLVHKGNAAFALVKIMNKLNSKEIEHSGKITFGVDYRVKILSQFKEVDKFEHYEFGVNKIGFSNTFSPIRDQTKKTYQFIKNWLKAIESGFSMDQLKTLLKNKKQIILQGPPGTGKTRLAKQIAESITKPQEKISIFEYVEQVVQQFEIDDFSNKLNEEANSLLTSFRREFPVTKIKQITVQEYAIGTGETDNFCYWLEKRLAATCRFSPGAAGSTVYGISYIKDSGNLRVDNNEDPEDFMLKLRFALTELIEKEKYQALRDLKFWYSLILKILHSYYPEKYFSVLSKDHLRIFAQIFKIDTKDKNEIELNQAINSAFLTIKNKYNSDMTAIVLMRHLYNKFDLKEKGFPESIFKDETVNHIGEYKVVQFHPSYTYEDFVRSIQVESAGNSVAYKVENKVLAVFAKKAVANPKENYVLVIDEINRANLSSVLGELIYALEYRGEVVKSMYATEEDGNDLVLPPNLFIIGTMNTADRSVGQIDYAIRRRFAFVDVLPKMLENSELIEDKKQFATESFTKVSKLFVKNEIDFLSEGILLESSDHLSEEFEPKDVWLGHSYFIYDIDGDFEINLEYEIKPILREYVTDGILKKPALKIIESL